MYMKSYRITLKSKINSLCNFAAWPDVNKEVIWAVQEQTDDIAFNAFGFYDPYLWLINISFHPRDKYWDTEVSHWCVYDSTAPPPVSISQCLRLKKCCFIYLCFKLSNLTHGAFTRFSYTHINGKMIRIIIRSCQV